MLKDLKTSTDSIMKESLLDAVRGILGKMEHLPKKFEEKIKDEKFLIEAIEKVLENENKKNQESSSQNSHQHNNQTSVHNTDNFRYSPYGGEAHIKNWDDLYHYFPHLGTKIRLWKLQFKEEAMSNSNQFKGCANPAHMVDWLVPDIDEIKKANKNINKKQKRY